MNAGKYGQASKLLKELLSSEPADQKARRLSATLNLKLGNRITAKSLFETLVKEALGSQDRRLAESLLREYLEAGPRYVPFLQLLGQVCEESGNRRAAVVEYGKALTILIEDEDTEDPELPPKLYAKIKELDLTDPVVGRFATMFEPPKPAEPAQPVAEPSAQGPPVKAKESAASALPPPAQVEEEVRTGRSAAPVKPSEVKPAAPRREGAKKVEASREPAAQPSAKPQAPPPTAQAEPVVEPTALSSTPPLEVPEQRVSGDVDASVEPVEIKAAPPATPEPDTLTEPQAPPPAAAAHPVVESPLPGSPPEAKEASGAASLPPVQSPKRTGTKEAAPEVEAVKAEAPPPAQVEEEVRTGRSAAPVKPSEVKPAAPRREGAKKVEVPLAPAAQPSAKPQAPPALPAEVPVEEAPAAAAPLENQKTPDLQPAMRAPELVTALTAEPAVSDRPEEVQDKPVEVVPEQKVEEEITPPPSEEKPHKPKWKTGFRFLESAAPPKRSYKPVAEAPLSAPSEARDVSPITAGSGADAAAQDTVADVSEEPVAAARASQPPWLAEPEVESVAPASPAPSADTGGPETLSFTARTSVPTPQEEIQDDLPAIGPLEELDLNEINLVPADVDTVSEGELEGVSANDPEVATTLGDMSVILTTPGVAGDTGETAVRRRADEAEESVNVPQAPAPQEPVIEFHELEGMPHQEVTHAQSTPSFALASDETATREAETGPGQEEATATVPPGVAPRRRTAERPRSRPVRPHPTQHGPEASAHPSLTSRRGTFRVANVVNRANRAVIRLFTFIISVTVVPLGLTALVWVGLGQSPNPAFQSLTKPPARVLQNPKENGYFLLLGFGVEETQDPLAAGHKQWEATGSSAHPQCFEAGGRTPFPLWFDGEAQSLSDWFRQPDPVGQFKKMKGRLQTWSKKHQVLLSRYRTWLGMAFDDRGYGRFANPGCTQILTAHRLYVADGFARGLSIGLSLLEQDVKKWRAVLPRAKTLSMKLMAAAAVNDDARILSGLLNRKEVSDQKISHLLKLMKPLELPERSLRWPLQHDLALRAKLLDSEMPLSTSKEPSLLVQVLEHMPLPRQRTLNAYADYYEKVLKASDRPRSDWPSLYQFANTPAKMPWDFVMNPVDNLLPARPKVDWEHRARELLETDARLRLVLLQARLRGTPKKELASRIARSGPRYNDPFTGFSMVYNSPKNRLYSVGKDGEDNDGDSQRDVSVVLAR